jgi:SAM-dependent methyltransferase
MNPIDLEAALPTHEALAGAALALADRSWAQTVVTRWQREMTEPFARVWLYQLGLLAANSLGRSEEFLAPYENFLMRYDAQTKPDWHAELTDRVRDGSMLDQSGRLGQDVASFGDEFKRVVTSLSPLAASPVLDVGCAGGAYSVNLAKLGFQVLGTDHHAGIIDDARRNAAKVGVSDRASFAVDDATDSKIPAGAYSRAICISVTPCLPNDMAFASLISHLDRVTRSEGRAGWERRVILGHNRWGPSRLDALRQILEDAPADPPTAMQRLHMLQVCWWLQPAHLDVIKRHFSAVTQVGEVAGRYDGLRVDLLLQ